jgi:Cu-Zn family superoxide dismutase
MRLLFLKARFIPLALTTSLFFSLPIQAGTSKSEVYSDNIYLGSVTFKDSKKGLIINPNLNGIPAGTHGFHIHEHPDCSNHGMNAGGHLDPDHTNTHLGPYGKGHLGDLPVLVVDIKGNAREPMLAPRLRTKDLHKHTIMIHAGGDNYSNNPPLGGGGARIGCGKITHFNEKSLR